jgi:Ca2+-transporting ATPase
MHHRAMPPDEYGMHNTVKAGLVERVHASIPGRARFRVGGLYRSPELQARLERGLRGVIAVHAVAANPGTGNLLIRFDPATPLERIAECIASLVRGDVVADDGNPELRPAQAWHAGSIEDAAAAFDTSAANGLSDATARERLVTLGANVIPQPPARSGLAMLLDQFRSLPVGLLAGAAVLSVATGGGIEAVAIVGVVAANATIGYAVESRTERTIRSLGQPADGTASVLRDGVPAEISSEALVPGDLILLRRGAVVPADARVAFAEDLTVSEALLTGESLPVTKSAATLAHRAAPLADRASMVYRGSVVTGGGGTAIVVATGTQTEMGRIQRLVGEAAAPATPLQRQLDDVGRQLVLLSLGVCGVVFGVGLLHGFGVLLMLRSSVSLAVAALPEGLPAVATTTLAFGVEEMRRRDVLVRRLDAVETLASVSVVCFDKTGTLTLNRMSVTVIACGDHGRSFRLNEAEVFRDEGRRRADPASDPDLARLLEIGVLCSEARIEELPSGEPLLDGSATEIALVRLSLDLGLDAAALRRSCPRLSIRQRSETYRFMVTTHPAAEAGKRLVAVKGSPIEVLSLCRYRLRGGEAHLLSRADYSDIERANAAMAGEALRVLGFAFALVDAVEEVSSTDQPVEGLVWVGLAGMADPVRSGAAPLMAQLHGAGIHTVMMTGDQVPTARAVARQLGLNGGKEIEVLDVADFRGLPPERLAAATLRAHVLARVSPAEKFKVIRALQRMGVVVAMVGDGINDSPALKAANVGIAMGQDGTDAARDVADIVLRTDDLASIALTIEHGRGTYANVRRSIRFLLGSNLSEVLVVLAATAAGFGQPLTVGQLLWINLVTDVLPALGLALEPPSPDLMRQPPRLAEERILGPGDRRTLAVEGGLLTAGGLIACGYGVLRYGASPRASTITFATLVNSQMLYALSCRPGSDAGAPPPAPNRALTGALAASGGLQLSAFLVPGLRSALGVVPIGPLDIAVTFGAAILPYLVNSARKGAARGAQPPE